MKIHPEADHAELGRAFGKVASLQKILNDIRGNSRYTFKINISNGSQTVNSTAVTASDVVEIFERERAKLMSKIETLLEEPAPEPVTTPAQPVTLTCLHHTQLL